MPVCKRRSVKLLFIFVVLAALTLSLSVVSAHQPAEVNANQGQTQYLPVLFNSFVAEEEIAESDLINQLRANAGVPRVSYSSILERNCFEHARYMAENGILTHQQDPSYPYASENGQICAKQSNVWLATGMPAADWNSDDAVMNWMTSVSHRIWLLYPTTKKFGMGFYTSHDGAHAGAALDVLSRADFTADENYDGWPVRYPGSGERNIPATRYPITINWRYFGPEPELGSVRLTRANGTAIAHEATTQMSIGHKGIQIIPKKALPLNSKIRVSVSGRYDGVPFSYSWSFYTNAVQYASSTMEAIIDE